MFERRSLHLPITLGVTMITLLVALLVGWIILTAIQAQTNRIWAPLYLTLLTVGATSLVTVLVGVVIYLTLSVKAINLNRRQSNFIDSVTHELKSPIASLKLYLQTLSRHTVDSSQREAFYRTMLDDVDRLDDLINHLLDAARMERRQVSSEVEEVRLDELLAQCAESVARRYHVKPTAVELDVRPCIVPGRIVDLEMIFRNLIDNAVKYADTQPQVKITLQPSTEPWVITRISDNGRGIPPDLRRKIFGRFVRLGVELEREKPGTGLGLYIVRTLVRRLKGRIRVKGRTQEPGTEFEVHLRGRLLTTAPGDADPGEPRKAVNVEAASGG